MVGHGGRAARYGLRDWLMQRVSAAFMLAFLIFLVVAFFVMELPGHAAWKALFSHGWMRVLSALFWLSLCLHAWVGMRDVLMDYVRPAGARLSLEAIVLFALAGYFLWAVRILWGA